MKALSFAVAAIVAAFVESAQPESRKSFSQEHVNAVLKSGNFDKQRILSKAVLVPGKNQNYRGLDQNGDDGNGFTLDGQMSVKFDSCMSLSVQDEDLLGEDYLSMSTAGDLLSQRSYVIFDLCTSAIGCSSDTYHQYTLTYMVDIATFIESTLEYMPGQVEDYCTGCQANAYYCSSINYAASDSGGLVYFYLGEKYEILDCAACASLQCFSQYGNAYEQNGWDAVSEWVSTMTCSQMEVGYTNYYDDGSYVALEQVYAGWMCGEDGDTLEIGMFADEECSLYIPNARYENYVESGSYTETYMYKSQGALSFMFTNSYECFGGETQYVNEYQQVYGDDPCKLNQYGQYNDIDECEAQLAEMYSEVAEVCQGLVEGGISLETCEVDEDGDNQNDGGDEDGGYYDEYGNNMWEYYFDGATFDISTQYQDNAGYMCSIISNRVVTSNDFKNLYDEDLSGTIYSDGSSWTKYFPSLPDAKTVKQAASNPSVVSPWTFVGLSVIIAASFFAVFYMIRDQDDAPVVGAETPEVKQDYVLA